MNIVTKKDFINGSLWKITEQFLTKGVSLLFSIVLTRMISPDAYGLLALTAVFTNLSDILIEQHLFERKTWMTVIYPVFWL